MFVRFILRYDSFNHGSLQTTIIMFLFQVKYRQHGEEKSGPVVPPGGFHSSDSGRYQQR